MTTDVELREDAIVVEQSERINVPIILLFGHDEPFVWEGYSIHFACDGYIGHSDRTVVSMKVYMNKQLS